MRNRVATIVALAIVDGVAAWAGSGKANEDCFTKVLLCGETRGGELTQRDCTVGSGGWGDSWLLGGSQGVGVELTAASQSTPLRLLVRGDELDQQTLAPPGEAVAHAGSSGVGTRSFPALVATDPATGNRLGAYSLTGRCEFDLPCDPQAGWIACAGQRRGRPPERFMVEVAFFRAASGNEGLAFTTSEFGGLGTYSDFPEPAGNGLVTRFVPYPGGVELRTISFTPFDWRMSVIDRETGATRIVGKDAENGCGAEARDRFEDTDQPAGKCKQYLRGRRNYYVSCLLDDRFQVELTWKDPKGKTGKGWPGAGPNDGTLDVRIGVGFTKTYDTQVMVRLVDQGDHVDLAYAGFTDWEYTLKVTHTSTGEVRTYHNPPGRVCATSLSDVFGGG